MTPVEKGRFCASCQKVVHDFTKATDREIAAAITKENNLCGRFSNAQLNSKLVTPKEKSIAWIAASAAVVSFLTFGTDAIAQTPVITERHADQSANDKDTITEKPNLTISGFVYDAQRLPLPGVNILVKGTLVSTQTDFDGKYSIEANEGDTIEYSFVGLETVSMTVTDSNQLNVCMLEDPASITLGVMVTLQERTFIGRIFTSLGNLFRKENKSVRYKEVPSNR